MRQCVWALAKIDSIQLCFQADIFSQIGKQVVDKATFIPQKIGRQFWKFYCFCATIYCGILRRFVVCGVGVMYSLRDGYNR